MFLLADDQHRAGSGADDAFGRATDRKMFPAGVTVSRNHDKIDIKLFGRFHDFERCQTRSDCCLNVVHSRGPN